MNPRKWEHHYEMSLILGALLKTTRGRIEHFEHMDRVDP